MRVLITGGTGFVGGWTAKAIQDAGHRVRFLVRDAGRLQTSAATLGVDVSDYVVGDITDKESVAKALVGCDALVHAAAVVTTDPSRADEMIEINLTGTTNVLGLAVEMGLDPIIHVSSITAIFNRGLTEFRADLDVGGGTDGYGQSKAKVEHYARDLQETGAPVVITYPSMVLGPPAGTQFGEAADGIESVLKIRVIPGRSAAWTIVDVRDLAALHAALLTPGMGPRRYMSGGDRLTVRPLAAMLSEISGTRLVHMPVPDRVLRSVGKVADRLRPVLPAAAKDVTAAGMQYFTQMPPSDNGPSVRELGITYRPIRETLAATVEALRGAGRA